MDKGVSRRSALLGLAAVPLLASRSNAQTRDYPPVFRTARHQFTIVEPAVQLPSVPLLDLRGRAARLAAVPGKVLLINIWATWCDACRLDLPLLERFHQTSGGRVQVAAVSAERRDRAEIKAYLERLSIRSLPIYLDPDGLLASNSANSPAPLSAYGMPVTYLVTPSGRVAGFISGVADWLADDAQKLLTYYAAA